ncbi:MAG: FTR1 family protein [Actinomycetota bacterium]|jgi:high-affinity iron transporter
MGSSFLITLREGLEASLIVAILLTYLSKTNRKQDARYVWIGTASAALACLVVGTAIYLAVSGLNGKVEMAVEGTIALVAAAVLTQMIFWMRKNSQMLSAELRAKVDKSAKTALFTIAFVAVVREGLETVLFLLSAETTSASGASVVIGGLVGLVASVGLGVAIFAGGRKIDLKKFFNVTAVLLILFAAGLAGKAVHEYRELIGWENGWFVQPAWDIKNGMWASGTFYDFMKGFFGWSSVAENIRVITYFVFLVPTLYFFRKPVKSAA